MLLTSYIVWKPWQMLVWITIWYFERKRKILIRADEKKSRDETLPSTKTKKRFHAWNMAKDGKTFFIANIRHEKMKVKVVYMSNFQTSGSFFR